MTMHVTLKFLQEGKTVFIHLDDSQELEINAENLADKTKVTLSCLLVLT